MQIVLNANSRLKSIKEQFTSCFDYLRMEFFYTPHRRGEYSLIGEIILDQTRLADLGVRPNGSVVIFTSETAVADFEQR